MLTCACFAETQPRDLRLSKTWIGSKSKIIRTRLLSLFCLYPLSKPCWLSQESSTVHPSFLLSQRLTMQCRWVSSCHALIITAHVLFHRA